MIDIKDLAISKDEVLKYLGHKKQNINEDVDQIIEEAIRESKILIAPKYVFSEYKTILSDAYVGFEGTKLVLPGHDIMEHLRYAKTTVLMAVTVGGMIEKKISYYEKTNLTKAIILDACATTSVEAICDCIEEEVREKAEKDNLTITFRYSPGYGDLPIDVQRDFVDTLNATKMIGLTVSEHNLLMPRKSVTAIIGIIPKDVETKKRNCEVCKNYKNCNFRREGIFCGS